jgi:hypothetical protein
MPPDLSSEAWAQIRHAYEHSERPVEDICAEYGISSGTLRDRMRRWGWTRRRAPIPREGPPPAARIDIEAPLVPPGRQFDTAAPPLPAAAQIETAAPGDAAEPQAAAGEDAGAPGESDNAIVPRLQSAVGRVLAAIEATLARLAGSAAHPREMERAARALATLTRTLRELDSLLRQHAADDPAARGYKPVDVEELRRRLARKLEAFVAQHADDRDDDRL